MFSRVNRFDELRCHLENNIAYLRQLTIRPDIELLDRVDMFAMIMFLAVLPTLLARQSRVRLGEKVITHFTLYLFVLTKLAKAILHGVDIATLLGYMNKGGQASQLENTFENLPEERKRVILMVARDVNVTIDRKMPISDLIENLEQALQRITNLDVHSTWLRRF